MNECYNVAPTGASLRILKCFNGGTCSGNVTVPIADLARPPDTKCSCPAGLTGISCEQDLRLLWGMVISSACLLVILLILVAVWFALLWKRANEILPPRLPPPRKPHNQPMYQDGIGMVGTGDYVPGQYVMTDLPGPPGLGPQRFVPEPRVYEDNWEGGQKTNTNMKYQTTEHLLGELKDRLRSYEDTYQRHNRAFSVDDERVSPRPSAVNRLALPTSGLARYDDFDPTQRATTDRGMYNPTQGRFGSSINW